MSTDLVPDGYNAVLDELKARVRAARLRAQRVVNTQLIELYWSIGATVAERQAAGWGSGVLGRLSADLRSEFPDTTGFSRRNLAYMATFHRAWSDGPITQQPAAQLPWGHIMVLLDKLDTREERDWYATSAVRYGWSRNVLDHHIKNRTRDRIGAAPSNFDASLPPGDSDLAQQLAKDPYVFDFLELGPETAERDLEQALMDRMVRFLAELGPGFAFVGRQVNIEVDGDDFYIDLLFFHTVQLRYVVFELKVGKFKPEYLGQLGFYVTLVDDRLRQSAHANTIGILLVSDRNDAVVKYALRGTQQPVMVSSYTYDTLPPAERAILPDEQTILRAVGGLSGSGSLNAGWKVPPIQGLSGGGSLN